MHFFIGTKSIFGCGWPDVLLALGLFGVFCCYFFFLFPFLNTQQESPALSLSVGGMYSSAWLTTSEQSAIDRMLKTDTLINFRSQRSLTKMDHKLPQGSMRKLEFQAVVLSRWRDCWPFSHLSPMVVIWELLCWQRRAAHA